MSGTRLVILVVPAEFNTDRLYKGIATAAAEQGHVAKPQLGPHHDAVFFRPLPVQLQPIRAAEDCQ